MKLLKPLLTLSIILGVFLLNVCFIPSASASTQIKMTNVSYKDCPPEMAAGSVGSGDSDPTNCFLVIGQAENTTGKTVYDADVFGRVYDANNEPAMQNRTRLGTLEEIPPGVSDFEVRISVPANQPTPLKLKQFKASGFSSKVRPYYYD